MESSLLVHVAKLADDIKAMQAASTESDSLYYAMLSSSPDDMHRLTAFIRRYIDSVPSYLQAFHELAEKSGIDIYTTPFIKAAIHCFLDNHIVISKLSGVHAYLCRAYLCHRMLEELNDRVRVERCWPLAPSDNTYVNIIVHTIIGDNDANQLDQTVLVRLETINTTLTAEEKDIFKQENTEKALAKLRQQGWSDTLHEWPVFTEDMAKILAPT
ncbi:hypothetical protein AB835_05660 [Candidatus Endobugula sertula]|uniref:Uncharacterized protein n=1 Tax=Candidatus Endobugula sertula TaxID=62101 RepID=A0A1D2QR04_9GAMM|nr:hypothetical protein AB835_05660 [Candidatus Endobugula sertula]